MKPKPPPGLQNRPFNALDFSRQPGMQSPAAPLAKKRPHADDPEARGGLPPLKRRQLDNASKTAQLPPRRAVIPLTNRSERMASASGGAAALQRRPLPSPSPSLSPPPDALASPGLQAKEEWGLLSPPDTPRPSQTPEPESPRSDGHKDDAAGLDGPDAGSVSETGYASPPLTPEPAVETAPFFEAAPQRPALAMPKPIHLPVASHFEAQVGPTEAPDPTKLPPSPPKTPVGTAAEESTAPAARPPGGFGFKLSLRAPAAPQKKYVNPLRELEKKSMAASALRSAAQVKAPAAPSFDSKPVFGATRSVPLGFASADQFKAAAQDLQNELVKCGVVDAVVGVRGSSVTGFSAFKGRPFGRHSDIDFYIESKPLTLGYTTSRNIPGFVFPDKMYPDFPQLEAWAQNLSRSLGRKVSCGAFVPGAPGLGEPAIVVTSPPTEKFPMPKR